MKIGILQTGRAPEALAPEYGDYDAFFRRLLDGRGFTFETFGVLDGQFPKAPQDADGWLITGSKFGAYEDHPWIPPLEAFVRDCYRAEVPMVGVCFGHQIMAQALGGKVEKFAGGWSVGPKTYQSDVFGDQVLIAYHQDQVVEKPEDARVLASSDFCANAALAYGDKALSIQPHPEFTGDYLTDLVAERGANLPPEIKQTALERADTPTTADKFADVIERFYKTRQISGD